MDTASDAARSDLQRRLDEDLGRFRRELRERLRSDVFLIDQGARYVVKARGKATRPFVTLACARLFGEPTELTYRAAAIVELLHTATLVHDDVLDNAEERRGLPSFNRIWGSKYAVLFGDYLLAHSLQATLENRNLELVALLAETARRIVQGQLKEWVRQRERDLAVASYYPMIADKTAALFRAAAELGALTMERTPVERAAVATFGEKFGLAFQIRDDILDLAGARRLLGKPVGQDIKDGKYTLPLLLALEVANARERGKMARRLGNGKLDADDVKDVVAFVHAQDGVARAQDAAARLASDALAALAPLGNPAAQGVLAHFIEQSLDRRK